jgi:glutamine amidotransferase
MVWLFALASYDPNLVGCALHLLQQQGVLRPNVEPEAYGLGYYQAGEPLIERQPTRRTGYDVYSLAEHLESEVMVTQARGPGYLAKDENTPPYRFRRFLFAHSGGIEEWSRVRPLLHRALPDFWQGQIRGDTDSELLFMFVLRRLRERGHLEDADVPAAALGRALREGTADVEKILRESEVTRQSPLSCLLTDGRSLAAMRIGSALSYRLIEGLLPCARCGLDERTPETHPSLRPHRRMRAVVFVSEEGRTGFVPVGDRSVITVSHNLDLKIES